MQAADRGVDLGGGLGDLTDRLGGVDRGGDALVGDLAGLQRGLGGLAGGVGARAGGAGGLLECLAGGLDHADLALGALGDVADRLGDLADRAAGLLGGRRHLLGRGRDRAGAAGDLGHHVVELAAHAVVAVEPAVDLDQHRVEGLRQHADLVGAVVLDGTGGLGHGDRQIALGDGAEAVRERGQVVRVEAAEAGDQLIDAALDPARDERRDRGAGDQRQDQRDQGQRAGGVEVVGDLLVERERVGLLGTRALGQVGVDGGVRLLGRRIGALRRGEVSRLEHRAVGGLVGLPVRREVRGRVSLDLLLHLRRGALDGGDGLVAPRRVRRRQQDVRVDVARERAGIAELHERDDLLVIHGLAQRVDGTEVLDGERTDGREEQQQQAGQRVQLALHVQTQRDRTPKVDGQEKCSSTPCRHVVFPS